MRSAVAEVTRRRTSSNDPAIGLLLRKWDWRKRSPSPRPSPPGEGEARTVPGIFTPFGVESLHGDLRRRLRKPQRPRHGLHRGDDVVDVIVEREAQQFRAFLDVFAFHGCGE